MENPKEESKYPIGGYAPGYYGCTCVTCKTEFMGDKRAVQCEPCAVKMIQKQHLIDIMKEDEELGLYEEPKQIKCYCGHTTYCDCGPLEEPKCTCKRPGDWDCVYCVAAEPKQELELKNFDNADILDVLNMGNVEYLGNGDIIYNPNLFFVKRGDKWFIKTEKPKQETLEETAEKYADFSNDYVPLAFGSKFNETTKRDFIAGAKYQAEQFKYYLQKLNDLCGNK